MRTPGISAFYHDSAAALIEDGRTRSASPARSMMPRFRAMRFATAWRLQAQALPKSIMSRSTTSHSWSSSGCAKPISRLHRAASAPSSWQSRCGSGRSCSRKACCGPSFGSSTRISQRGSFCSPSIEPRRIRLLPLTVRKGCSPHHGRGRRMGDGVGGDGRRQSSRDLLGDSLPPFARPALFGRNLLHRLQGQFR